MASKSRYRGFSLFRKGKGVRIKQRSGGGNREREVRGMEREKECRKKGDPGGEVLNSEREKGKKGGWW